jgi:hypothetical protein
MATGQTNEVERQRTTAPSPAEVDERVGFGSEFRELARQRRFVRDRAEAAAATLPQPHPGAATPAPAAARVAPSITPRTSTRISDDQRAVLLELSRMSDRLVQAREELAAVTARATRTESDLAAANERLMATRVLVQDAQRATHASAERAAWLEGRCETLQEALDLAVNASMLTRWRWRRQQRVAG